MNSCEIGAVGNSATQESAPGIRAILNPASIAIIGMSSKPGSLGQVVLRNVAGGGYQGDIHLVGRSGGSFEGRRILGRIEELPDGVDLAILMLPSNAILEAVRECIARKVKAVVCFASGFAEMGEAGLEEQQRIAREARSGGLTLLGPNTVGYFNYVNGFYVMLVELVLPARLDPRDGPAIAVVAQSGGVGAHIAASLKARGVPLSYTLTTGNEAQIGLAEMIDYLADDAYTGVVVVYAEQIRSAAGFVAAVRKARARGKSVVLLHPGRSERSREAAKSHTGAMAGNHAAMSMMAERAGVAVVQSLEEAIDVGQLLLRYPQASAGGLGLVTASGAICGLAQDYVEPLGFEMPALSARQSEVLREHMPAFLPPRNPLDLGTIIDKNPELIAKGVKAILDDPGVGSLLVSLPMPSPAASVNWLAQFHEGRAGSGKPAIFVMNNEDVPLCPEFAELARRHGSIVMRSPERALRALHRLAQFGKSQVRASDRVVPDSDGPHARMAWGEGVQSEWIGKRALRDLGISTPAGDLARTLEQALAIAESIGYPVVLKAQAAALAHKSEVGGVLLDIKDAAALGIAWEQLQGNLRKLAPAVALEGVLVERMGRPGLELVVGATRDAQWGPILMLGLGGIWVEALGDVQLLPPDATHAEVLEKLRALKAARLLKGFRGSAPVDLDAVAQVVCKLGQLMLRHEDVMEVDINPLVAYPAGQGAVALDALFVIETAPEARAVPAP